MSDERSLLSRWSQRKAAARRGDEQDEPADLAPPPEPSQDAQPVAPNTEAADEDAVDDDMPALPSIEELDAKSDYSVFMHKKVPEALRRAALRKLWTSDPVLANLDGLNDYDEDYNLIDTTIAAVQTAYKVGQGYLDDVETKLERVDRVLGQTDESPAAVEASDAGTDLPLGESDAAVENSSGAVQHVAAGEASTPVVQVPEHKSK